MKSAFWSDGGPQLVITPSHVWCGRTLVRNARWSNSQLEWDDNKDATRGTKPVNAHITFTDDFSQFEGTCQFPGEGPLGYVGTVLQ